MSLLRSMCLRMLVLGVIISLQSMLPMVVLLDVLHHFRMLGMIVLFLLLDVSSVLVLVLFVCVVCGRVASKGR